MTNGAIAYLRALILFPLLCFVTFCSDSNVTMEREGDVVVVRNSRQPMKLPGFARKVQLKEDLCLGRDAAEKEGYVFASIRALQVDNEENIIVLDWKDHLIKVFDPDGCPVCTFGKQGQGPGEIQSPSRMYLKGGEYIALMDNGNHRFSLFDKSGECLEETNMGKYSVFRAIPDSQGYVYGERLNFTSGPIPSTQLLRISPDFKDDEVICDYEFEKRFGIFAAVFDRIAFTVDMNDRLLWGRSSRYVIHVHDWNGKEIRRIHKEYEAVPITEEDRKQFEARLTGDANNIPGRYSPFYYFICDDTGRIYVRTYERNEEGRLGYDIFDKEGRFFSRLFLPEGESLMIVKRNKAYCSIAESPEEGIPLIKRYTMNWH